MDDNDQVAPPTSDGKIASERAGGERTPHKIDSHDHSVVSFRMSMTSSGVEVIVGVAPATPKDEATLVERLVPRGTLMKSFSVYRSHVAFGHRATAPKPRGRSHRSMAFLHARRCVQSTYNRSRARTWQIRGHRRISKDRKRKGGSFRDCWHSRNACATSWSTHGARPLRRSLRSRRESVARQTNRDCTCRSIAECGEADVASEDKDDDEDDDDEDDGDRRAVVYPGGYAVMGISAGAGGDRIEVRLVKRRVDGPELMQTVVIQPAEFARMSITPLSMTTEKERAIYAYVEWLLDEMFTDAYADTSPENPASSERVL